jgi:hypothetical protein
MTRICVQATVGHPAATTAEMLQAYMAERARGDGTIALPLRMRFRTGRDDLSLAHDVLVRFRKGRDADDLNDTFYLDWEPSGEGPYPSFSGTMNVYAAPDPRESGLEIDGTYDAPGGFFGRLFDAFIGRRMARVSLADLVDRIAGDLTPVASSPTRR